MSKEKTKPNTLNPKARPPVVVVMGHVDHGKSTLLDYIRKTNVVDSEVGGITQRISAYEVIHKNEKGEDQKITFLDTPGHEAFSKMRERGAEIADIAILVVSAEDGVKPQTIEAWKSITRMNLPAVVAINKIDKPGANVEKTKIELAEHEIYLENFGGKVPFVEISAKTGVGIDDLLTLILITTEMENWQFNPSLEASGFVLESNMDSKRGIQSTLIIKDGTLKIGMTIVAGGASAKVRNIENYLGKMTEEASACAPVRIFGFDNIPEVGQEFRAFLDKKQATEYQSQIKLKNVEKSEEHIDTDKKTIAIVLKADVAGSLEALEKEIKKIKSENAEFKIISKGIGMISESDIKAVAEAKDTLVVGFNVKADRNASEIAEQRGLQISFFDIIYKATEWLAIELENRRPKIASLEVTGRAKILRAFSKTKEKQILGGKVLSGSINMHSNLKILRREFEIGQGKISNLEQNKAKTGSVDEGQEFGMMVESKVEIAPGDIIESFSIVQK